MKTSLPDLKQHLIVRLGWLGIQQSVTDQAIDFTLMHVSKPQECVMNTCYDVLFHNCQ